MANEKEVIILNKPFLGGWLNEEGRIGHEIIDFFLADNGNYYVYNNPWGLCPEGIWVGNSEKVNDYGLEKTEDEKYIAEYMVLASDAHALDDKTNDEVASTNKKSKPKYFHILYVIKLKAKIHRFDTGKGEDKGLKKGQEEIGTLIKNNGIAYNGKLLNKIYGEDDSLYLTFEADPNFVYKVKEGETLLFEPEKYNFARNRGYIYEDTLEADYKKLSDIIKKQINLADKKDNDGKLEKYPLTTLGEKEKTIGKYHVEKTFLDLIGYTDSEQVFTNLLHTLLKNNEVFKKFCKEFKGDKAYFPEEETFAVEREKKVEKGRMDISGESKTQKVIIENKIDSGLNGLDKEHHTSQLSTYYYKWGKVDVKEGVEPLCFITAPDYRKAEIEAEIKEFDPEMIDKYHIVTYGKIAEFLEKQEIKEFFKNDDLISLLYGQIVNAFKKWSYKSREDLYADLFLQATETSKKTQ